MVTVFALTAAILYGGADFLGGAASRRTRATSVLLVSAPAGAVVMVAAALISGTTVSLAGLGWALAGGAIGGAGLIAFYAGLAAGPMSVVAPVSALVSTVLPVGVAVASGEHPSPIVFAGAGICLVAIVMVSAEGGTAGRPGGQAGMGRGLAYGTLAGIAFGLFFVLLREAGASGVLWPVAFSRIAGMAVVLVAAAWLGARPPSWAAHRPVFAAAIASGVLDATANVSYVLATRAGLFGIAVVLTSLYPGITVLLARVVLGERMRWVQRFGLVLALAGVILVTG